MRALSMLRPEILSLAVLIFVQIYAHIYRKLTAKIFRTACWAAIINLIFDILTVLTVNEFIAVPKILNDTFHFAMYVTAMTFCVVYLDYIATQVLSAKARRWVARSCTFTIIAYCIVSPFMTITYTQDSVTNYSGGNACWIVMGTAFVYFIAAIILMIIRRKRFEPHIYYTILFTTVFMISCVAVQLIIPTFLFTGGGIAIATIGMFFAIENPVKYYRERAFIDISTGIKNKNCFHEDLKRLSKRYTDKDYTKLTIVVGDLNWLKYTNDTYGHLAGDDIIRKAGEILAKYFKGEYGVYRIGGDEFIIMFINKDDTGIEQEIQTIYKKCGEIDKQTPYPFSLSLGYATTEEFETFDTQTIITTADKRMYEEKTRLKAAHPEYVRID